MVFLRANSLKIGWIIVSDNDDRNESDDSYDKAGTTTMIKAGFWGLYGGKAPNAYPKLYELGTILQNSVPPKFTSAFHEAFSSCMARNKSRP